MIIAWDLPSDKILMNLREFFLTKKVREMEKSFLLFLLIDRLWETIKEILEIIKH